MRKSCLLAILVAVLFNINVGQAQRPDPSIESVDSIGVGVYRIALRVIQSQNWVVNVTAITGPQGVLLIDNGWQWTGGMLDSAVAKLESGDVKMLINTHSHLDHAGTNVVFESRGVPIIASETCRQEMSQYYFLPPFKNLPGLPSITFSDSLTIHFNGKTLHLASMPRAHSGGDITVKIDEDNLLIVGDLIFPGDFPYVNMTGVGNGSVDGYGHSLETIVSMCDAETRILPGHGDLITAKDVSAYNAVYKRAVSLVDKAIAAKMTRQQMIDEDVVSSIKEWKTTWVDHGRWIRVITADRLGLNEELLEPVVIQMTRIYRDTDNIGKAIKFYRKAKKHHADQYAFREVETNQFGYQLIAMNKLEDAKAIFKLNVEEYPDSWNTYDSYAEALMNNGETEEAIKNYEKSVELNPDNSGGKQQLERLRGEGN